MHLKNSDLFTNQFLWFYFFLILLQSNCWLFFKNMQPMAVLLMCFSITELITIGLELITQFTERMFFGQWAEGIWTLKWALWFCYQSQIPGATMVGRECCRFICEIQGNIKSYDSTLMSLMASNPPLFIQNRIFLLSQLETHIFLRRIMRIQLTHELFCVWIWIVLEIAFKK